MQKGQKLFAVNVLLAMDADRNEEREQNDISC
jgi:hypothetical protein